MPEENQPPQSSDAAPAATADAAPAASKPPEPGRVFSAEKAQKLIRGEITLAQYVGLTRRTMYRIATVGHQMLKMGKYDAALEIFQGLVAASPFDSVFHVHLGATLANLERYDEAMEAYNKAINFNIANVDALASRGELYLRRQEIDRAIADLQAAVKADRDGKFPAGQRARALLTLLERSRQASAPADPSAASTAAAEPGASAPEKAPEKPGDKPAEKKTPPPARAGADSFAASSPRTKTSDTWSLSQAVRMVESEVSSAEKKPPAKTAAKPKAKK